MFKCFPISTICLAACFFIHSLYGQKEIEVRDLNTTDFPNVSGKLWVRNPNGIKTDRLKFLENDLTLGVTFGTVNHFDSLSKNKSILFLVLNSSNTPDLNWYQNVIKASLSRSVIS